MTNVRRLYLTIENDLFEELAALAERDLRDTRSEMIHILKLHVQRIKWDEDPEARGHRLIDFMFDNYGGEPISVFLDDLATVLEAMPKVMEEDTDNGTHR